MMAMEDITAVRLWCRERVPEPVWESHRCEAQVTGRHIDIVDCRFAEGEWVRRTVARLLLVKGLWVLQFRDSDGSFHAYRHLGAQEEVGRILTFLSADRDPLFWG